MLPDRLSNPGPLTYESGVLPIALCGPARSIQTEETKIKLLLNNRCVIRVYIVVTPSAHLCRHYFIVEQE